MDRKFLSIGMMAGTAVEKYRTLQRGCCETWIPMCDKVYLFCGKHYDFDFEGHTRMCVHCGREQTVEEIPEGVVTDDDMNTWEESYDCGRCMRGGQW